MEYIFIFTFAIVITIVTNHILLAFSKNLGMRGNEVKQVRWASTTKPSLGGFAFYIVFLGVMAFLSTQNDTENILINKKQLLGAFVAISIGFFVGFADDTYNTNPFLKFVGQFACAIVLYLAEIQIDIIPGSSIISFIFTSLWVVGLMNSINMLDNMDGITASASVMIIIGLIFVMYIEDKFDEKIMYILLGILASSIGFLYHNWNPAKMYMGDAGSQFLGVFLSIFSVLIIWSEREPLGSTFQFRQLVLPALLFIIPLIDTITVTFRRLMRKQSPFIGGRDHTTHHFVYYGLKEKYVAILYIFVSSISLAVGVILCLEKKYWNGWVTLFSALFFISIFITTQIIYNLGSKKNNINKSNLQSEYEVQPHSTIQNAI